ncbi:MAG TPA: transporter [Gammaproteobacteria bacterium]|nr:transporter [Gammaproteobacteria bacterium]
MKYIFFLLFLAGPVFASENSFFDPCSPGLIALINRPSMTGSPCVVPNKQILLEGGYQHFNLMGGATGYVTPQAEIRFGLPGHSEFLFSAPTFFHQTISPRAGWSAMTLSLKHEIGSNAHWLGTIEGLVTPPTGSENYGSRAWSGAVDGIMMYTFSSSFSVTGMLGVMSQSVQYIGNGARFTSINPDILASWQLNNKCLVFAELYSQTRTGAGEGLGLLTDAGILYLPIPEFSLDAELGQRITGNWGFQSYAGLGFGVLFG